MKPPCISSFFVRSLAGLTALWLFSVVLPAAGASVDTKKLAQLVSESNGQAIKEMGPAVMPELVRMYESADESQREKIAAAFYQLRWKSPEARRVLMKDIHTKNQALRLNVQYALGSVSDDVDVVDALIDNMEHDGNALFRDKAACALAYDQVHLTPKQKVHLYDRLIEALGSDVFQVRQIALQALQIHTGQTKGFRPNAPEGERRQQIQAWRKWLDEYRSNL